MTQCVVELPLHHSATSMLQETTPHNTQATLEKQPFWNSISYKSRKGKTISCSKGIPKNAQCNDVGLKELKSAVAEYFSLHGKDLYDSLSIGEAIQVHNFGNAQVRTKCL